MAASGAEQPLPPSNSPLPSPSPPTINSSDGMVCCEVLPGGRRPSCTHRRRRGGSTAEAARMPCRAMPCRVLRGHAGRQQACPAGLLRPPTAVGLRVVAGVGAALAPETAGMKAAFGSGGTTPWLLQAAQQAADSGESAGSAPGTYPSSPTVTRWFGSSSAAAGKPSRKLAAGASELRWERRQQARPSSGRRRPRTKPHMGLHVHACAAIGMTRHGKAQRSASASARPMATARQCRRREAGAHA